MDSNINKNLELIINDVINGKGDSDQHLMTLFSIAIQIKAKKHTKKQLTSLKLLGAEYKTTCSSIK